MASVMKDCKTTFDFVDARGHILNLPSMVADTCFLISQPSVTH